MNPYHHELWEYNIHVAEDAVRLGFGEVQFDYIRFPEPYKSLPPQVFPDQNGQNKEQALADFLALAHARLSKLGVRTTADIFGLVTSVPNALEVGQQWEHLAPVTDVLLPMTYPSHYPPGSLNVAHPNAEPYAIIHAAIVQRARARREARPHRRARASVAAGVHARQAAVRARRTSRGEARGVRRGVRRVGAVESGVEVRAVPQRAGEDEGLAQEGVRRARDVRCGAGKKGS